MHPDLNVIGRNIAKLRYQRGWTQDTLVGKMQLLGCYMTRDILANIETLRSPVTDKQIEFFAEVFRVDVWDLFPPKRHFTGRIVGLEAREVTRQRCSHERHAETELAEPARK
jgi:transcriptional regulator with XRE-family HTH domain